MSPALLLRLVVNLSSAQTAFKANKSVLVGVPEDTEWSFELYYRLMLEEGKLQVTPHLLFVIDPGGGINWVDDTLVILGLRVFVPF